MQYACALLRYYAHVYASASIAKLHYSSIECTTTLGSYRPPLSMLYSSIKSSKLNILLPKDQCYRADNQSLQIEEIPPKNTSQFGDRKSPTIKYVQTQESHQET